MSEEKRTNIRNRPDGCISS